MTTHTGYVMTLANSIIGVSLLAMPYCFKQCGVALGILLLLTSNIVTRLSCHFLLKSATMSRRKNFEYVAYHAFGSTGKFLVELGVILFMLGTSVAFFVVIGDLGPAIVSKILRIENDDHLRTCVLLGLVSMLCIYSITNCVSVIGIFFIFPLCLLRNIESLAAISTVTMFFYFSLVFKLLTESFPHLAAADWLPKVNFWRLEGVLQCFPIFTMALFCQTQLFEILEVLPNPTLERMNDVVRSAVGLSTGLYIAVGFLGYVAFARETFGGNVLLSFNPSTTSDLFQLGFVISIALSYPIVVFPCRASLNSLLFKKGAHYQELTTQNTYITDGRFKMLTVAIVAVALGTGLLIPSVEVVLGFVGSTIAVAICVIFPASAFINISEKKTTERLIAKVILLLGLAVMVLGVYGNMNSAILSDPQYVQSNSPFPPVILSQLSKNLPIETKEKKQATENQKPRNPVDAHKIEPIAKDSHISISSALPPVDKIVKNIDPTKSDKLKMKPQPVKNVLHEDAIAKEELELKEDDSLVKKEQAKNEAELLKKLQEHKKEQQQLLKEQQNILDEIKNRDNVPNEAKPIEPHKFSDNIAKIQEVIDELKEKKQANDLTIGLKIAEDKKKNENKKISKNFTLAENKTEQVAVNMSAIPLLLLEKKDKSDDVALGRDILAVETSPNPVIREKRETDDIDGSCVQTDDASKNTGIQESKVISPPVDVGLEKESNGVEKSNKLKELIQRREETRK